MSKKHSPLYTIDSQLEPAKGHFLVYQTEDGKLKLDVRLEGETVWLTQPLMAELFQTTQQNISQHILNVYEEGELAPEATHKKSLSVRLEGKREVKRLDGFLQINDRDILNHAGQISHEMARQLAENEYEKFNTRRIAALKTELSDFDRAVKQIDFSNRQGGKKKG